VPVLPAITAEALSITDVTLRPAVGHHQWYFVRYYRQCYCLPDAVAFHHSITAGRWKSPFAGGSSPLLLASGWAHKSTCPPWIT